MNKILFYLMLTLASFFTMQAQVIYSENFDSSAAIPSDWASFIGTNGLGTTYNWTVTNEISNSAPNCVAVRYENVTGGLAEDWLVTPMVDLTGTTSPFVQFMVAQTWATDYGSTYELLVSTTSQTDIASFTTVQTWNETTITAGAGTNGFAFQEVDLSAYIGQQVYIAFLMKNDDGDNFILDDVIVRNKLADDIAIMSIDTGSLLGEGMTDVKATFQNYGSTTITDMEISWSLDGGTPYTEVLSGLNIGAGETYSYTSSTPWDATEGVYNLEVSALTVNGNADSDTSNNTLSKAIEIVANSVPRTVLYEEFTSATCNPCGYVNTNTFNQDFYDAHEGEFALIKYQVNWPTPGDIYYTAEGGARVSYYGINGAPTILLDAQDDVGYPYPVAGLEADINAKKEIPAFIELDAVHSITGNIVTVDVTALPHLTGDYKLHVVVVEKTTTGNVATNGETSFEHVMMKMLPDASGTDVSLANGQEYTITLSADMSNTNVEEMSDLAVIAFIQNDSTKEVMQAANSTEVMSVEDLTQNGNSFIVYPNPSNGIVNFRTDDTVIDLTIFDISGKEVYQSKEFNTQDELNVSHLEKGVYIISIEGESGNESQKLIIQ